MGKISESGFSFNKLPPASDVFEGRHNSATESEVAAMLEKLGCASLEEFVGKVVPADIRRGTFTRVPEAATESEALEELRKISEENRVFRSFIGAGYYGTRMPSVIQRTILENPGWYTAYTPYQAEISQGRLEALLNFQTMVCSLTGLEIANASMLDEGTAAAEAMTMCLRMRQGAAGGAREFFVSEKCHPQTIEVVRTRAVPMGIDVVVGDAATFKPTAACFGVLVQYPDTTGSIVAFDEFFEAAHAVGAHTIVATDLLALTLLRAPGEFGADVAVGSTQRFGVPMGLGGPHAGFLATRDAFKRQMPGRLLGVSKDAQGGVGLRLALGTREQHIRRDKATSNICTAQVLLAVIASMFAVYHGPAGLKKMALRVKFLTDLLAEGLRRLGAEVNESPVFDTLTVSNVSAARVHAAAEARRINLRKIDETTVGVSLDETAELADVETLLGFFGGETEASGCSDKLPSVEEWTLEKSLPEAFLRKSAFLDQAVFNSYHTEHELLRYIKRLESRDLSLCHSMISLGSCTMKLNAASEMMPISWNQFAGLHPFAPGDQWRGFARVFDDLEKWLCDVTGFAAVSLQPNSGASGEYAGLLTIRAFHESRGEGKRNVCLIPVSAHGTNPASAAMCGYEVVVVACDERGNVDVADLRAKAAANAERLAALMITYPSTHGVFETSVRELCEIAHEFGGQVYMDGANMNAQVGLTSPGEIGADVCHLNLHKTFAMPHGGGGPGLGPIGVARHLAEFLPKKVASAPYGSALINVIAWMYIRMMGGDGLRRATELAVLNANYVAARLDGFFPVLYRGESGFVAHECIVDFRDWKKFGIEVEDVAKRLMDYGYHAPTMSFPVPGTLMVEPTESESLVELDRFCDALISIHAEMKAVAEGCADKADNVLKNAPHTAAVCCGDKWERSYPREQAAFPTAWVRANKFWPAVSRVDNVWGDRNLRCVW